MPLTWFAHQGPVIGLKMARPAWFDATAMCVGSMMPDLMYSFSGIAHFESHEVPGAFGWGLPLTMVTTMLVRFWVAPVAATQLPDLGDLRLHSYGVLARRRPRFGLSVVSAIVGIGSHIMIDSFTHAGRLGTRLLGYNDVRLHAFGHVAPSAAVLQALGHVVGSVIAIWLLLVIGRGRLLEQWYGSDAVEHARSVRHSSTSAAAFWTVTSAGPLVGLAWAVLDHSETIQRTAVGGLVGVIVASRVSAAIDRRQPVLDVDRTG
jgi:hypothetical protein